MHILEDWCKKGEKLYKSYCFLIDPCTVALNNPGTLVYP